MDADQENTDIEDHSGERAKITGSLIRIASLQINDTDTMWMVRHYTGLGNMIKLYEVYVTRKGKFLGRFTSQEKFVFESEWVPASWQTDLPSDKDVITYKKVRMSMFGMVDKLWPEKIQ